MTWGVTVTVVSDSPSDSLSPDSSGVGVGVIGASGGSDSSGKSSGGSGGFRLSPFAGKTPVVGMVERNGNVKAKVVKNVKAKTMQMLVRENINRDASLLITDESLVYKRISRIIEF